MGNKLKTHLQDRLPEFLRTGNLFTDVQPGDDIERLNLLPEKPKAVVGNDKWGFFNHYSNGLRIAHNENKITGITILFPSCYAFNAGSGFYLNIPELGDRIKVSAKTKVTEMVTALNSNKIAWHSQEERSLDVFCMLTMGTVFIAYRLDTGELDRITT